MIVERTENPQWLSNAYLVADPERGTGVLIDGNEDVDPLIDIAERDGIDDHPLTWSPTRTSTTSPGSPRRASGSAARRWSPTRRPRRSSTTRSR